MASSLVSQLGKVRSHNADRLSSSKSAEKARAASYLFPANVAATQDYYMLHGLARNGWEELCASDTVFAKWGHATGHAELLFGDTSRELDRFTQTKEENEHLDRAIMSFYELVSDSLLDRSAAKCIEWLVRRFRVHEHNVEATLALFIPFHETNEFVRMLHIVNLVNKPHLSFLQPVQKQNVHLPSSVLIAAATKSPSTTPSLSTLRWLLSACKTHQARPPFLRPQTVMRTFWLSTILKICTQWSEENIVGSQQMGISTSAGKRKAHRDDDAQLILSVMLPSAAEMITSEKSRPEDCVVGCMAMCSIAGAFDLSTEAARSMLSCLIDAKHASPRVHVASFSASAVICRRQDRTRNLAGASDLIDAELAYRFATKIVASSAGIEQSASICTLEELAYQVASGLTSSLSTFAAGVTNDTVDRIDTIYSALEALLALTKGLRSEDASSIVAGIVMQTPDSLVQHLVRVVAPIRQRLPDVFDEAVRLVHQSASEQDKTAVDKKVWAIITGGNGSPAAADRDVVLSASDSSANTRLLALRKLLGSLGEGRLAPQDPYAKNALRDALSDEDVGVVDELYADEDLLVATLDLDDLLRAIVGILATQSSVVSFPRAHVPHMRFLLKTAFRPDLQEALRKEAWQRATAPRLVCTKANHKASKTFYELLGQSQDALGTSTWHGKLLTDVARQSRKPIETDDWVRVNVVAIQAISKAIVQSESESDYVQHSRFFQQAAFSAVAPEMTTSAALRPWSLLLLANVVMRSASPRRTHVITRIMTELSRDETPMVAMVDLQLDTGSAVPDLLASPLYKKSASPTTLSQCKTFMAHAVISHMSLEGCAVLGQTTSQLKHAQQAFVVSIKTLASDRQCGTQLATKLLQRLADGALVFLASMWTGGASFDGQTRLAALTSARSFLAAFRLDNANVRRVDFQTIVPSILVALKDEDKRVRLEALQCLGVISNITRSIESAHGSGEGARIYAYDALYGSTAAVHLRYLESQNTAKFLQELVSARESFVNDALYLNSFMASRLALRKDEGKREVAYKLSILQYMLSHIVCWDHPSSQVHLLETLEGISHQCKLQGMMPLLSQMREGGRAFPDELVRLAFAAYDWSAKRIVEVDEHGCWTLFTAVLEHGPTQLQRNASKALAASFYANLSAQKQRDVVSRIARLVATSSTPPPKETRSLLSLLPVHADILVSILGELRAQLAGKGANGTSAKRSRNAPEEVKDTNTVSSVLGEVLESLLERKAAANTPLIAELFETLRVSSELQLARMSTAEYLMQLSMSNLSRTIEASSETITTQAGDTLRIDTIVSIVKMPCRPQTFHQALLLMSTIGKVAPELVLHHSMPIFTFVGTSMLQRDDDYSFTVIAKTLQSILPAVAADLRKRNKHARGGRFGLLQLSRSLLCVFTDAATHVPRHRRATFFQLLASALGSQDYLGALCMLLVDRQAGKISRLEDPSQARDALQLPLMLLQHSEGEVDTQLLVLDDIWQEVERTWLHHSDDPIEMQEHVFLDCVRGVGSEHDHGKVEPVRRIVALLQFAALAASSTRDSIEEERFDETSEECKRRDAILRNIIERALRALKLSRVLNASVATFSQKALDLTLSLLSVATIESVINPLLDSGVHDQQRIALSVISKTIGRMAADDRKKAESLTPRIITLSYDWLQGTQPDEDARLALETLSVVALQSTNAEHTALAKGLATLCRLANGQSEVASLLALSVLQSLSKTLGPRLIPQLAGIVGACCAIIADMADTAAARVAASLDLLSATIRSVPAFASGHLDAIFAVHVARPALLDHASSRRLMSTIVGAVPSGDVLQAVYAFYEKTDKGRSGLALFSLNIAQRCIKTLDRKKIVSHYKSIFRFIVQLMDMRRLRIAGDAAYSDMSDADLAAVESECVETFSRLVLKLNESTFRPLFLRLCDWAMLDLVEEDADTISSRLESQARQVPLFKTLNSLMLQLGELIVHYYANVLDGTIETLGAMALDEVSSDALWTPLVQSVVMSARVDKGAFWNEGRVNKILPALVAQLTTPLVHGKLSPEQAVGDAISGLCQTVATESCLKEANNRLLVLARDVSSTTSSGGYSAPSTHKHNSMRTSMRTRIAAIHSMERLWSTKGCEDALLNLVPETVPSVAELLQETDIGVQEAMLALVAAIEGILGESLDAYLQ